MVDERERVTEVVIYRIQRERIEDFQRARAKIRAELARFDGLLDLNTEQHVDDPFTFRDLCTWRSKGEALYAFDNFRTLPSASEFLETFDGRPVYCGHFRALS